MVTSSIARWLPASSGTGDLFSVESSAGPVRAIRLHHPTKTWIFDSYLVQSSMMDDFDQGEDRISMVGRLRAEEVAHLLEAVLPSQVDCNV